MDPGERFQRNVELARARLDRELEAATAHVEEEIGRMGSGIAGALVSTGGRLLYNWIGRDRVVRSAHRQFQVHVEAVRALRDTPLDEVVEAFHEPLFERKQVVQRGNTDHPRFHEVESIMGHLFRHRLQAVARVLEEGEGEGWDEVVRSVLERDEVEDLFREQFRGVERIVRITRDHPRLMPTPPGLRGPLFDLVERALDWYELRLARELDRVFGGGSGDPRLRSAASA